MKRELAGCVGFLCLACVLRAACAQPIPAFEEVPTLIAAGFGTTPRYSGAKEKVFGVAPAYRYQFPGSGRYLEWWGTLANLNLVDSRRWGLGPALNFRFGRHDAEDAAVAQLAEVGNTLEGGVVGSYTYLHTSGIPFRVRLGVSVLADLGQAHSGANVSPYASLWVPLSRTLFVGVGGGFSWASASYNRAFYGVTPEGSAASGLPVFTPGSGVRQIYAWPALVFQLLPGWYGGLGFFYQRLTGDAAASPIVAQRGERDQVTAGFGIGYAW